MKAHNRLTNKQKQEANKAISEYREQIFVQCANDITAQLLGTVFWTLAINLNWGAGRLRKFADLLHETKDLMDNPSHLHHKFSGLECLEIIKEKIRHRFSRRIYSGNRSKSIKGVQTMNRLKKIWLKQKGRLVNLNQLYMVII